MLKLYIKIIFLYLQHNLIPATAQIHIHHDDLQDESNNNDEHVDHVSLNNGLSQRHQIYDSVEKKMVHLKDGIELSAIRPFFKCAGVPTERGIKKIDGFENIIDAHSIKDVQSQHKCQWLCRKAYYDGEITAVSNFFTCSGQNNQNVR